MHKVSSIKYLKKIRVLSLLTLAILYFLLNTASAKAGELSLGIDPVITTINTIAPVTVTSPISIVNKSDATITLQIQIKPFQAKGENGEIEYVNSTPEFLKEIQITDAGLPIKEILLEPKRQKNLNLIINVPPDASASDYYFSVIFISTDPSVTESNSSSNQIGIASNILLTIGALENPKTIIEEFSSGIFFQKGPVPFRIRVKNSGTHLVRPEGQITIKNMFGQSIGRLDLTSVNILSDSIRAIPNDIYMQELRIKDAGSKNTFDFTQPIALWKESFLLGFYTATLNLSMSDEGPSFTRSIHFFAFPLQILAIIIFVIIGIIIFRIRLKHYSNKNRT